MLNLFSSRIITDFRKVPVIIHMFCQLQIHETALKDMTNKLAHQFAFHVKTCNKFVFNFNIRFHDDI